jgi:hypothetical protein
VTAVQELYAGMPAQLQLASERPPRKATALDVRARAEQLCASCAVPSPAQRTRALSELRAR